jgi:branched-chain amino acid transport system ATP-binding protein
MMLKLENVHTFYGQIEALKGVSLDVQAGEIVTLIGANGAGKSTLLLTVCGAPRAARGAVFFEGQNITHKPTHVIMQCGLALVPEGRRIFPGLTVRENLQMGGFFADQARLETDLERVFTLFPRLKERRGQRGGTLSGGEQQMLAIGRGLMSRPNLLLLDEPSLGLAPIVIAQIFQILKEIREEGVTIFLVEQNAHRALQLADRGYVLENGRIVLADTSANLLANDEVRKAYLGG